MPLGSRLDKNYCRLGWRFVTELGPRLRNEVGLALVVSCFSCGRYNTGQSTYAGCNTSTSQ